MAAPLLSIATPDALIAPPPPRGPRFAWLREPLLHFILAGGLLFALDHALIGRTDDPHTIVVGPEVDREAIEGFRTSRGREPNQTELNALRKVWLDNEVLYREGLTMQVDKGDDGIRERVIFKALSVVDSRVKLPPVDDKVLSAWFESHREKYDEPPRFDFEEAAMPETSEAAVRAFVNELNGGAPGDAKAGLRVYKGRPFANLLQSYGPEFPKALSDSKLGQWGAYKTREGWRAMRLIAITAPRSASFESLRGIVLQDWTDAIAAQQRTDAVRAMAKKYNIIHQLPEGNSGE